MENNTETNKKIGMFIVILLVAFGVLLLFMFTKGLKEKKSLNKEMETTRVITQEKEPTPTEVDRLKNTKGQGLSSMKIDKATYTTKDIVFVTVNLDSLNKNVVGFDLIVKYDPQKLDYMRAVVLNNSFNLISRKNKGELILTGLKKLKAKDATVFSNSGLVKVSFQPKTKGETNVSVVSKMGKDISQFVTDKSVPYAIQSSSVRINIK